jgi:AraC-like DNA-binding protein
MLEDMLSSIDPATSRTLGTFCQRLADTLLAQAEYHEAVDAANARRRAKAAEARRAADAVAIRVERGETPEAAIADLAARLALDPAQIAAWWRQCWSRPRRAARRRDLEIMRLAGRGWTNAQLAAKFKLSESAVSRTIRRMLTARPASPPPATAKAALPAPTSSASQESERAA